MRMRRGQVAIYLIMALVVIVLLTLLNVDTFLAVRTKDRLQNGGDAAALAAARKQGALLNEIGRLNLDHLVAAIHTNAALCAEIELEQRRLALVGPVDALRLANDAAKKNGRTARPEFAAILAAHVNDIRLLYAGGGAANDPFPESYPGAWTEYATAINNVVAEGLATGADNIEFYYAAAGHTLLSRQFYLAVSAEDWCWFHWYAPNLLTDYNSFYDWAPLPIANENAFENSEIFSLHVSARKAAITDTFTPREIRTLLAKYADVRVTEEEIAASCLVTNAEQTWFFYDGARWGRWFDGRHLAGDDAGGDFPIVGEIKPEYNVRGCAAVCRCADTVESVANGSTAEHTWAAGAKPFGTLEDLQNETMPVTGVNDFIVPAFTATRLVPLDAVGGEDLATADLDWVTHVRYHLGNYLLQGPGYNSGCFYCRQLGTWEHASFREKGARWLRFYGGRCTRPAGNGTGGSGGTSHGH